VKGRRDPPTPRAGLPGCGVAGRTARVARRGTLPARGGRWATPRTARPTVRPPVRTREVAQAGVGSSSARGRRSSVSTASTASTDSCSLLRRYSRTEYAMAAAQTSAMAM